MFLLYYVLAIFIAILFVPVSIFLLQVVAATSFKNTKPSIASSKEKPSVVILMPAHNESLVISQSIETVLPQLQGNDRLVVVADNCTDQTATIAKKLGATVVERRHEQDLGKGYALDFGLQYLESSPPDVVVVVDADCIVANDTIERLALACVHYQRPMQALYLMESQPKPSLKARVAQFAWIVKNKVRPLGWKALGFPCQLMGTGMAFLWRDLSRVSLATGHIVEDMKLGADLARLNKAPLFLPEALVTSVFPPTEAATNTQRARWEHGHLSVILNEAPSLIFEAAKNRNIQMLGLACDLLVPPLAVLSLLCVAVSAVSLLFGSKLTLLLSGGLLGSLLLAVLLAWIFFGRGVISFKQLCYAPIYALVKIPLYLKFFLNRQVEWVRSKRD